MPKGMNRGREWTPQEYAHMAQLFLYGLSRREIAKTLRRAPGSISSKMERHGLKSRDRRTAIEAAEILVEDGLEPALLPGWPKQKPCLSCGETMTLNTVHDHRRCESCHRNHAGLDHLEGLE